MKKLNQFYSYLASSKIIVILAFICLLSNLSASGQISATISGPCAGTYVFNPGPLVNGRNSYVGVAIGSPATIFWNGSAWIITLQFIGDVFFNSTNTSPDPPCHNNGVWSSLGPCTGSFIIGSSGTCALPLPLPIELVSFAVENKGQANQLTWQTATELLNQGFEIQRAADGILFETIATVAGKGTVNTVQYYTFSDEKPLRGINYYRLRQLDFNGDDSFSKIISVSSKGNNSLKIYPNPVSTVLNIDKEAESYPIQILNLLGQVVQADVATSKSIDVSHLLQGTYILRMGSEQVIFVKNY